MRKQFLLKWFAVLALFAVVAAACGDDDETPVAAEETPVETATGDETPVDAPEETPDETPDGAAEAGALMDEFADENIAVYQQNAEKVAADNAMEPFVVGWINQDSGLPSFPDLTGGVDIATEYINTELGGVDGHPIQVVKCDAGSTEEEALACAQELANDDSVQLVITGLVINGGPIHTTLGQADKPILGLSPLAAADFFATDAFYISGGVTLLSSTVAAYLADFLAQEMEVQQVALMHSDNDAGNAAGDQTDALLQAAGFDVSRVRVADDAPDVVGPLTAAGINDADVLVPLISQQQCIQTAQAMQQLSLDIPVVTAATCLDQQVIDSLGGYDLVDGWLVASEGESPGVHDTDAVRELVYATAVYGGEPKDDDLELQSGLNLTGFKGIMQMYLWAQDQGFDAFSGPDAAQNFRDFVLGYTGGLYLNGPEMDCPGQAPFTAICVFNGTMLRIDAEGNATDALGGGFIDVREIVASLGG